jgi:spermidine synthase
VIATNGKPDAGVQMGPGEPTLDEGTMVLAAAIPLSMHPHPTRVANIGFGSGLTTHTLLMTDLLKRLDSVEIEPFMVEAAKKGFGPRISNVFADPRSHIVYEDAKTFFASTREPYDLIVSEPSNPWVSGVATLFSDEFYAHVVQHLAPDGYFVQWVQIYETNLEVLASVIKALAPHFQAYALYYSDAADVLIVATRGAELPTPDNRLVQSQQLQAEFKRVGIQSVTDIALRKIGDNRTIGPMLEAMPVPANSDYFPFVDLNAPRLRFMAQNAIELTRLTILPFPFLELLDGSTARIATVEPAVNSPQVRDSMVRRALEIRRAVASDSLNTLDPMSATYLSRIDMSRERCAGKEGQLAWKTAIRNVSDETAPYLNADELQQIWSKVKASPCYQDVAGRNTLWADLFAAISQRDAPQIAKLGTAILDAHALSSDEERAYLTTVTAAAYVRTGEIAQARSLLQMQLRQINKAGQYELALRELVALAQPARAAKIAQTSR